MPDTQEKARILICEDEVLIAKDLESRLKRLGYTIVGKATSGERALELVERHQPDLVMLDIVLHGEMDGIDVAEVIRDIWSIPVVFLTAYADTDRLERAKLTYPFGYLLKPFQDRDLKITTEMALYVAKVDAERKKSEAALRESEERYLKAQAIGHVGSWEYNVQTTQFWGSDEAKRIYGFDVNSTFFSTDEVENCIPERERVHQALVELIESDKKYDLEFDIITYDKKVRKTIISKADLERDETGRPIKVTGVIQDITERKLAEEALACSRYELDTEIERRRAIFDKSPDGILIIDTMTAGFLDFNTAAHQQLGYTREEFVRLTIHDIEASETPDETWDQISRVIRDGRADFETLQRTRAGDIRHVHVTAQIIKYRKNELYHCVWRDITDRKKAEEALRESEEKYRRLADNSPDMIFHMSLPDGTYKYVSPAVEAITGYPPDEFYKKPLLLQKIIHPDWCDNFQTEWLKTLNGVISPILEYQIVNKDRTVRWVNQHTVPVRNRTGDLVAIEGIVTDTTDRKLAEIALKSQRDRFEYFIKATNLGTWEWNIQTGETIFNERWAGIIGYSLEEISPTSIETWFKYTHPVDLEQSNAALEAHFSGESEYYIIECRMRHKDGRWVNVISRGKVISWSDDGKPLWMYGTHQDITSRKVAEERLRRSEELSSTIQRLSKIGAWEWDITTQKVFWTDEVYRIHDLEPDSGEQNTDDIFEKSLACYGPEDRPVVLDAFWKCAEEGIPYKLEFPFTTAKGRRIWVKTSAKRVIGRNGVNRVVGYIMDITDQLRNEEILRREEKKYKTILQTAVDGFHLTDLQGRLLEINDAYCRMSGYSEKELLSMFIPELEGNMSPDEVASKIDEVLKKGHDRFETKHRHKDGSLYDVEVSVQHLASDDGRLVTFLRDISERKKAESAILDYHARLAQLLEFLPDATFAIDTQGKVLIWNRAMEELTGLLAEDMLGRGDYAYSLTFYNERRPVLLDLVLKPDPEYEDRYTKYSRDGDRLVSEAILDDFRGRGRTWLWNIAGPLRDTDGKVIGAIESIRDVTNWRMLEEEKAKIESHIRQSQKMEAIGTLAGGIAHDFNNILSAIIGYSELLQMKLSTDQEALSKIQEILKAGLRARDLVQQILTFSRKTDQERKPIQIDLIVDEVLKLLRATLPSNIEIEKQLESKSLIMGDSTQIHQVVMNLCTNAGHAMREDGGKLRVELYDAEIDLSTAAMHLAVEPGNYLNLVVSDTGSGIKPDLLERIFEPFFTTKARDEGTGMGLSVVHGIVTGLGGMIHAYSEPGLGSTFSVFLPVLQSQGHTQAKKTDLSTYHGTETILMVDDEIVIAKVAAELLSSLGYRVEIRSDSQEALTYFKENPRKFDLVIADVTMPALTGDRLAQQMLSINKDLPIILATGSSNRVLEEKVRELGVRAIIAKPFVLAKIAATIRQALDGEQTG